LKNKILTN